MSFVNFTVLFAFFLVEIGEAGLTRDVLETKGVYILDCHSELYVWIGRRCPKLLKSPAMKLCLELKSLMSRPGHAHITKCLEG